MRVLTRPKGETMLNASALKTIAAFFSEFSREPLYNSGFGDAVNVSGATDPDEATCRTAWAYLHGYADGCRLACEYQTPPWQIAHLMAISCGMFASLQESTADDSARAIRCVDQYRRELADLVARKESA